jgi:hypothetical protein
MFNLNAHNQQVSVDDASGRPLAIRSGRERRLVSTLESVRDETAAYPLGSGPRTVFVVRAQDRRYRLTHLLRDGRWMVEELAQSRTGLAEAA